MNWELLVRKTVPFLSIIILTLAVAPIMNSMEAPLLNTIELDSRQQIPEDAISVLVSSDHDLKPHEVQLLTSLGTVTTIAGPIAVLHIHASSLTKVEKLPFISQVQKPRSLNVYLEKSVPDIGAVTVWHEVKDPYGRNVTGEGVVIGFVDTGIDTTHPDFIFPNGTTKILYVWDQTIKGRPPVGFGYGYECAWSEIQAKRCPEHDTFGHGTHVAGIAASTGQATANYTGVAPGAGIIFVKSGHEVCGGASWTFDVTQILDGLNYIVKKADELGKRAVINLSLGGNIGAHDGTDPLELGLDAFVRAGTPVVVAAGNSARDDGHARGQLSQGESVTLEIAVKQTTTALQMDVWYSPQDRIDARLTTPDGKIYTIPTPPRGVTSSYGNITGLTSATDVGKELFLEVNSPTSLPSEGWSVTLTAVEINSQGKWDAWLDTATCSLPGAFFLPGAAYDIDPYNTIGIPGTARYVVTVGAYVTKSSWRGMNGQTLGISATVGEIAQFSSWGPTRDGRIKPDVAAPGMLITSARSSSVPRRETDPDAYHRILAGTSMATPHVAGAIALMLQYDPHLRAADLPRILRGAALLDSHTGLLAGGSPIWGFGKLDTRTATGFFRVTLIARGIPESLEASVQVDGGESLRLAGDSWTNIHFLKGASHTLTADFLLQGKTGTRYRLQDGNLTATQSILRILNYTTQYFLSVNSPYDQTTGTGWYDANTTVKIGATARVPGSSFLGYLGAEYVLIYWVTDDAQILNESVTVDRPKSVTAVYVLTYPVQTYVAIIVLSAGVILIVLLTKRRMEGPP
mgnify:FL=1